MWMLYSGKRQADVLPVARDPTTLPEGRGEGGHSPLGLRLQPPNRTHKGGKKGPPTFAAINWRGAPTATDQADGMPLRGGFRVVQADVSEHHDQKSSPTKRTWPHERQGHVPQLAVHQPATKS